MNQVALINDRVRAQPDFFQFQQALPCGSTISADTRVKTCFGNLRGIFIVNLPNDMAMEGWRCDGDFARAVAILIHNPIYALIESMWQNATSGVRSVLADTRYAQQNPQIAFLVDSEHGEMVISSSSALQHFSEPLSLGSTRSQEPTAIGPTKRWAGYLAQPFTPSLGYEHADFPRRIPEDATETVVRYPRLDTNEHQAAEHAHAVRRVERLTEIQAKLGLSMQMLAEVLLISRPQLYKWFDVVNSISLQKKSIKRLDEVEQLARKWSTISVAPLKSWVQERIDGGKSLFDLLTVEPLSTVEIEHAFMQIAARIARAPKSRGARMRAAGFTRRKSHRSLPSDE